MSQNLRIDRPLRLLGISGSLRSASSNTTVLHALQVIARTGVIVSLYDGLADLPYFNPDLDGETDTPPAPVGQLRTLIGPGGWSADFQPGIRPRCTGCAEKRTRLVSE